MIRHDIIHATAVAINNRAVVIRGASGCGKSALGLDLMAMGADLISDDQVILRRNGDQVVADAPDQIRGMIEARGVGLLRAKTVSLVPVGLVVDLGRPGQTRLPRLQYVDILGIKVIAVAQDYGPHLGSVIRQCILGGIIDPDG